MLNIRPYFSSILMYCLYIETKPAIASPNAAALVELFFAETCPPAPSLRTPRTASCSRWLKPASRRSPAPLHDALFRQLNSLFEVNVAAAAPLSAVSLDSREQALSS